MIRKLILFTVLSFCLVFSASAWNPMVVTGGGESSGVYCSSCTPGDPTDVFCEDVENSGAVWCTYSDDIDGTNSVTAASHQSGLSCTGKGSYALEFDADGAQGESVAKEMTVSNTTLYFNGYLVIRAASTDTTTFLPFLEFYNTSVDYTTTIGYKNTGGTITFQLRVITQESGLTLITGPNIVEDTWYRVGLYWTGNTTNGVTMSVDGVDYSLANGETTENVTVNRVILGAKQAGSNFGAGDTITYQWDIIGVDDDTMPGACS